MAEKKFENHQALANSRYVQNEIQNIQIKILLVFIRKNIKLRRKRKEGERGERKKGGIINFLKCIRCNQLIQ